jgi:hypothetical protein
MAGVRLPFRGVALTAVSALGFALIGAGSIALRAQFDAPAPSDAAAQAARTAVLPDPPSKRERRAAEALVVLHPAAPAPRHPKAQPAPAPAPARPTVARRAPQPALPAPEQPASGPRAVARAAEHVQLVDMTTGRVVATGAAAVDDAPTGGTVCPLDGCP